jgi:citronellol/citronellal dehydrogenase
MSSIVFSPDLFAGQVALVSGGGTGIGLEIASAFARCGAKLVLCGRRLEPLQSAAAALGADRCLIQTCDIRQAEQCEALVDAALKRFGRLDVCVNNAGGQFPALAENITAKGFAAVVTNNLNGTWNLTRAVAVKAFIVQKRGRFVNIIANVVRGFPTSERASKG